MKMIYFIYTCQTLVNYCSHDSFNNSLTAHLRLASRLALVNLGLTLLNSPNSLKPSGDNDGISKHRLTPIMPTLKHYNIQKFPVLVLLKYSILNY